MDQYGNKVSIFETEKEVDEKTLTKENNIFLARKPIDSLLSVNVEYLDKIDTSLMIEADITKKSEN